MSNQPRQIVVTDPRPEMMREDGSMRHVATFNNVPQNWSDAEVIRQFGIASHLRVTEYGNGAPSIIQRGREDHPRS